MQRLSRPDPETRSDADDQRHEIFDHIDGEVWGHVRPALRRTGDGQAAAVPADPAPLPMRPESLLVEEAGDDDGGRNGVEHAEHPDPHHQLLQLLRLGAIVLHDGANSEQRNEAGEQERSADEKVNEERGQHEPS